MYHGHRYANEDHVATYGFVPKSEEEGLRKRDSDFLSYSRSVLPPLSHPVLPTSRSVLPPPRLVLPPPQLAGFSLPKGGEGVGRREHELRTRRRIEEEELKLQTRRKVEEEELRRLREREERLLLQERMEQLQREEQRVRLLEQEKLRKIDEIVARERKLLEEQRRHKSRMKEDNSMGRSSRDRKDYPVVGRQVRMTGSRSPEKSRARRYPRSSTSPRKRSKATRSPRSSISPRKRSKSTRSPQSSISPRKRSKATRCRLSDPLKSGRNQGPVVTIVEEEILQHSSHPIRREKTPFHGRPSSPPMEHGGGKSPQGGGKKSSVHSRLARTNSSADPRDARRESRAQPRDGKVTSCLTCVRPDHLPDQCPFRSMYCYSCRSRGHKMGSSACRAKTKKNSGTPPKQSVKLRLGSRRLPPVKERLGVRGMNNNVVPFSPATVSAVGKVDPGYVETEEDRKEFIRMENVLKLQLAKQEAARKRAGYKNKLE